MTTPDRSRGILTKDDRTYLTGRKDLKSGSERNARQRIRDRTRNSLYDFKYLVEDLDEEDVSQLANDNGIADDQIFQAAEYAIAFIFKLCGHASETGSETTENRFRNVVRNGIEKSLSDEHELLDYKLDLTYGVPREARNRLFKKVQDGESLTLAQLREVLNNDYLDDSYQFKPLDQNGLPKNADPKDLLSHDDFR